MCAHEYERGIHIGPREDKEIGMILKWSKEKRGLGSGSNRPMSMADSSIPYRRRGSISYLRDQASWSLVRTSSSSFRVRGGTELIHPFNPNVRNRYYHQAVPVSQTAHRLSIYSPITREASLIDVDLNQLHINR